MAYEAFAEVADRQDRGVFEEAELKICREMSKTLARGRRRSPEVLEQAVNERSERRTLGKDQDEPDDEEDDDDRDQPPAFILPEELEQFSDDPQLRKEILDRAHVDLDPVSYFRIMKFSRTSTSMPLLLNVE
jgi:hypothetical protein